MRISKTQVVWYLRPFFWLQERKYKKALEPSMVWARVPKLFLSVASFFAALERKKSPISPELRSLITVLVSQINHCSFCVDINSALLIKRSGSENKCLALEDWQQSDLFSKEERAALDYAEQMTFSDKNPDDRCFAELKKHFKENEIIELTALIAFQNMSSKFNSALDIKPQGFCSIANKNK